MTIHWPRSTLGRNFRKEKRKIVVKRKLMMRRMERRWGEKKARMNNFRKRTLMRNQVAVIHLHLRAAAVGWAEARHGCRAFFDTYTHGEGS